MGMSITPLREALRRLRGEGLIDIDVHKNTRVARMNATEARRAVRDPAGSWTPPAAELAAQRRTDADIKPCGTRANTSCRSPAPGERRRSLAHSAFHRAIYVASHNDNLIGMLDGLWDKSDRYRRLGLELGPGDESRIRDFDEHRLMMNLVIVGDGAGSPADARPHHQQPHACGDRGSGGARAAHTPRVGMTRR